MFFLISGVAASGKSTFARLLPEHLVSPRARDRSTLAADAGHLQLGRLAPPARP